MSRFAISLLSFALPLGGCFFVVEDDDDDAAMSEGADATGDDASELPACGDPGTASVVAEDGSCYCEASYVWCTDDPDDFSCCLAACGDPGTNSESFQDGSCECLEGFVWCTDDPDDFTCCAA